MLPTNTALEMSASAVPGHAPESSAGELGTTSTARYHYPAGEPGQQDLTSDNQASTIPKGPSPFLIARKKLPWLDGVQQLTPPGDQTGPSPNTVSTENKEADETRESPTDALSAGTDRPSVMSLGGDPSLREVGSAPSMRNLSRPHAGELRTLSLSAEPRPGVRPPSSRNQAKRYLRGVSEMSRETEYSPSEYSAAGFSEYDRASTVSKMNDTVPSEGHVETETRIEQTSNRLARSSNHRNLNQAHTNSQNIPLKAVPVRTSSTSRLSYDEYDYVRRRVSSREHLATQPISRRSRSMSMEIARTSHPSKDMLHELPAHLVGSSSSSQSIAPLVPVRKTIRKSVASSPDLSPRTTMYRPTSVPANLRRESQNLDRAVTGLGNLMEEALAVARDAAQQGRTEDVARVLDSATLALRNASAVQTKKSDVRLPSLSESSTDSSSDTGYSDESTTGHGRRRSSETAPTVLTKSTHPSRPIMVEQYTKYGNPPASETAVFVGRYDLSGDESMTKTPPRLYQANSADSVVRDFAYLKEKSHGRTVVLLPEDYGAAADYYGDTGQSVITQPGIRQSIVPISRINKPLPDIPRASRRPDRDAIIRTKRGGESRYARRFERGVRDIEPPTANLPQTVPVDVDAGQTDEGAINRRKKAGKPHVSEFFETSYFQHPQVAERRISTVTDASAPNAHIMPTKDLSLKNPRRTHISLREGQGFSLGRYHRRQPIAREWKTARKRITAIIACFNTIFIGLIAGIYAGEVPRIQYQIADISHKVILGNVLLFIGLGLTTLIFWPLPLLHGRKPYTLMAFALMLPLQFPQALAVSAFRDPENPLYKCGLLIPRILTGLAMGFANINQLPTLFDLFGVSLMSARPHQEVVSYDDVRRQGGGVGLWLGIWSFCFIGSLSIGFCVGACIISTLDPSWGFYIVVILLAFFLLVNVIAPETRRAPYRRSIAHFLDDDEKVQRRVARGEVKLHISNEGPKWWFQEVWAGIILSKRMIFQPGYFVLMLYIAWIYCQVTIIVLLLGALLSRDYQWQPQYVGLAALSLAMGAALATPLAKASLFSRSRFTPQRTDSMTMQRHHVTCSSHLTRRCVFTLALPFAGLAYTLSSPGTAVHWSAPTIFCGLVGFLSNLAIAECIGLIMETFDTCDLQPGANTKHRLQSMGDDTRRRRTNYSSFPRVCAGFFCAQSLGFFLAAAATGISGDITRALGAQTTTAIVAAILLIITLLLMAVLYRFTHVDVIPNTVFSSFEVGVKDAGVPGNPVADDSEWKPVIIGNPSGKMRRVNMLELGAWSRWTEIRKLKNLVRR